MQRHYALYLSIALLFIGGACCAERNSIVQGRSIGQIKIHEDEDKVYKTIGRPTFSDAAMGHFAEVWQPPGQSSKLSPPSKLFVMSQRDESGFHVYVAQACVTSPRFVAGNGIHVGNRFSAIRAVYRGGKLANAFFHWNTAAQKPERIVIFDDEARGIAFAFPRTARGVNPNAKCTAIIVHPESASVFDLYATPFQRDDNPQS